MKFLFTCGGTAGHINPALGVAGRIRELMPDAEFLFVGALGQMESELVPREGFEIKTVEITNVSRSLSLAGLKHNLKTFRNLARSSGEARRILREFKPDVAVGTGGYVCYPVLKQAHALGIPTAVHESNAVPGLTTRMLEKSVDCILVGFEESRNNYKHPERVAVTGTPVRGDFLRMDQAEARKKLGLDPEKPLIVSVWGSLGATVMNGEMAKLVAAAGGKQNFTMIHSAGKRGYKDMMRKLAELGVDAPEKIGFDIREYIYDMPLVMAAADIVLCRAGASTLAELAALGKPAVLVPSPNVTNNHQEKNARVLERAGAAKVFLEGEFSAESLLAELNALLEKPEETAKMSEAMKGMGVRNATERITETVLALAEMKG